MQAIPPEDNQEKLLLLALKDPLKSMLALEDFSTIRLHEVIMGLLEPNHTIKAFPVSERRQEQSSATLCTEMLKS